MEKDTSDRLSIEDLRRSKTSLTFECGPGNTAAVGPGIKFKVPPAGSPYEGRLMLAKADSGGIKVHIDLKNHVFSLQPDKESAEKQLLIRIPVGIRVFSIPSDNGMAFYYETSEGYDILPHHIPFHPKSHEPGQTMQEVVLVVSVVPPRDASQATSDKLTFPRLTNAELNARRKIDGLQPLP
jgi:hypothetical protein